ncbi:hypothetical protein J7F01_04790 [Streptomyces sp. ISL-22]|uniref:Imm50 family immunity protein n=1 Tax=unclassified Streptomyces TaxID=2593676 RepID=UPI001BE7B2E2|nr:MULTISPECIES: Imm50 family immunity protein [unclassified Streptomyces]MBT2418182.1 hypothetical protein [Streptomyces sp. ISL-24]MBT2431530.1 hypothetical protein [Streptomyces sp. ISL-22]
MTWNEFLANGKQVNACYGDVPELSGVRLRSINVNWRGPQITLRIDLNRFPEHPEEWRAEADTFQCHITFLAAEDITLTDWRPPATADIVLVPEESRRLRATASGPGVDLGFSCSGSLHVDHLSAFRITPDGADSGRHLFMQRIDARLCSELPVTYERRFYAE